MSRSEAERSRPGRVSGHRVSGAPGATFALVLTTAALLTLLAMAGASGLEKVNGIDTPPAGAASAAPTAIALRVGPTGFENARTQRLGLEAIEQLDFDWEARLPDWQIEFVEGNTHVAGYTWTQERRIEVFVRPNADATNVARILAHELGHAVDVTHNTPDERRHWLDQRSLPPETPWWPSSGAADFETGAGDFAESFAAWLVGPEDFRSRIGPKPSAEDLALLARLAID